MNMYDTNLNAESSKFHIFRQELWKLNLYLTMFLLNEQLRRNKITKLIPHGNQTVKFRISLLVNISHWRKKCLLLINDICTYTCILL